MKAINQINPAEKGTAKASGRRIAGDLTRWMRHVCITVFLAAFLMMIFAPANASKPSGKNNKGQCKHKATSFTYPVIITKKSSGYHKDISKSKKRKYSFPV
jgi:hypothetical protein